MESYTTKEMETKGGLELSLYIHITHTLFTTQVITDVETKCKILEACHDDRVGGCHFGRDKTGSKVSARFYWKGIQKDVAHWVMFKLHTCTCIYCRYLLR